MKMSMIVALALLGSCTKKNPDLCCTTDDDCASVGLPMGTPVAMGFRASATDASRSNAVPAPTALLISPCAEQASAASAMRRSRVRSPHPSAT